MHTLQFSALIALFLVQAAGTSAQNWPTPTEDNPATRSAQFFYAIAKRNILESAEKMPEADFAYRPTPEVRTFGQILAHIADAQYTFCSSARKEPNPNGPNLQPGDVAPTLERTKGQASKAELLSALKAAFAFCEPVFARITDADWQDAVKLNGNDRPKATPVLLTLVHLWEHYGNLTTYLREKHIVPPSTERLRAGQRP